MHSGIHKFIVGKNAKVKYIEKHIEQNDMIIYKISITKAEFFNLHGE